jgi:monoterpene epsilon-lactone hydrolase
MSLLSNLLRFTIWAIQPLPSTRWSITYQRTQLERLARLAHVPEDVVMQATNAGALKAAWFTPREHDPERVILYFHGGAYMIGSINTHREITALIARYASQRLLSVEYRLAPEHPYPAALEDAHSAYFWLIQQGYDPSKISLAGDSAGGGLCMSLMLSLRDAGDPLPAAAALLSPWADLAGAGESLRTRMGIDPLFHPSDLPRAAAHYLNGQDPRNPLISPVYANLHGLPPVLIQVGDQEILLSDATRLYHGLHRAGGEADLTVWPGLWHVFHAAGDRMQESKQALRELGAFLHEPSTISKPAFDLSRMD